MILFICDSRGKGLQQYIAKYTCDPIHVSISSGAKIYQSATRARFDIKRLIPNQIYLLAGVNNLTDLNRDTRLVNIAEKNYLKASDTFMTELIETYEYIKGLVPNSKIITAPLTGMSMASYNGQLLRNPQDQDSLNDTVVEINKRIIAINENEGMTTPWTSSIIHRYYRRRYHFAYHKLEVDGCHLSDEVKDFWGKKLAEAILANS